MRYSTLHIVEKFYFDKLLIYESKIVYVGKLHTRLLLSPVVPNKSYERHESRSFVIRLSDCKNFERQENSGLIVNNIVHFSYTLITCLLNI